MGFGTLPVVAAVLVALNGLYILLVAFGNITDFGTNQEFVRHVLAMDTTNFGAEPGTNLDQDVMWRAIENETVQDIAYIGLIAWESLTALVLLAATLLWVRERGTGTGYRVARGFIVIGGEWFQMWKSTDWNGLEPAFRNATLAGLALVVVHLPSGAWGAVRQ